MNKSLYRFVARGLDVMVWGGELTGDEFLPEHGPAVFVSNHLGALGPIAVGASVPFYLHSWVIADMLDEALAPDYLNKDFVEPQLHVPPPFSRHLARALTKVSIPLLRSIGGIPVHHATEGLLETYRITVDVLEAGDFVLIFPEDPVQPPDPLTKMTPFKKGFARLGELYFERTRRVLGFYPLAVHARSRTVRVGQPVQFNPNTNPVGERVRIKRVLESSIRGMLLEAELGGALKQPLVN
ncbi:MAG: lysophospholipid acyltransferase family protein [Chloroflexota bacterium]